MSAADTRAPLDARAFGVMLLLCTVWALQQVSLKLVAPDVAPTMMIGLRTALASVLVVGWMRLRGERIDLAAGHWRAGIVVGALFAVEFLLIAEALKRTLASHVGVFLYTAPVFAALGLHARLPSERLARLQWVGVALAFAGAAVALLGRGAAATAAPSTAHAAAADVLLGDALALAAGLAWGATTVVLRTTSLARAPASETLLYQLVGAALLLLAVALGLGEATVNPTPRFWAHLAFNAVVISFASYLAWFALLRRYVASRLGLLSFMTPVLGVLFGAWLLGERLAPSFLVGAVLVLAGLSTVSASTWLRQRATAKAR